MVLGYRELVRLKMSVKDVNNFTPPKGLDITWHDYDYYNNEVTASIVGSEFCPEDTYFVYKEEVNHMLSKLKIAQDGIRDSKYPIKSFRSMTTPLNYIQDTENDNLIKNSNVHDVMVDKKTLNEIKRKTSKKIDTEEVEYNNSKRFKLQITDIVI